MKKSKTIFRVTTILFSILMMFSAFYYLMSEEATEAFNHLGFPAYLRVELAVAKFVGALILVLPFFGSKIKEWTYAGFGITLISAFVAHVSVGDGPAEATAPLIVFLILMTSYIYRGKVYSPMEAK